jgi:hypothetical protein
MALSIETIIEILDKGIVEDICDCCPCGDIYVFGGVETYLKFVEATNWYDVSCSEKPKNSWQSNCCTDNCFSELSAYLGDDGTNGLLDKGFIEYSLLNGKSTLCVLYEYIVANNLSKTAATNLINQVLDKGIVFACSKDTTPENGDASSQILASVETFLQFAEATGYFPCMSLDPPPADPCTCLPKETCCFDIKASVETYLKYAEAINLYAFVPPGL